MSIKKMGGVPYVTTTEKGDVVSIQSLQELIAYEGLTDSDNPFKAKK